MALSELQESALAALADREIARPALEQAVVSAQAALADVQKRLQADRDVIQLATNVQMNDLEATYRAEMTAAQDALTVALVAINGPVENNG